MESWKMVWRDGFQPQFSDRQLLALRDALLADDPTLIQGATTQPPPLLCVADWSVEACCAVSYCGWKGADLNSVGDVEEFFARSVFAADDLLGEPAASRWFLNAFDNTPRDVFFPELAAEITRELERRAELNQQSLAAA
jgi:hypothetical protein